MSGCRSLFITGTDTGVGKTQIAGLILSELVQTGLRLGAYKPVCSGADIGPDGVPSWSDLSRLQASLVAPVNIDQLCNQRYLAPLAPPLAAEAEQRSVDISQIDSGLRHWTSTVEALVIEGAGGWLCPLTSTQTLADWVTRWNFPVLIVARRGLGTINHTLLTVEAVRRRGLPVVGVVLNQANPHDDDPSVNWNSREIEARAGVPVFGEVLFGASPELRRDGRRITMQWLSLMSRTVDPNRLG